MEPDFASPEEDAGDQQVTFQDAELMNEARIVGEGPSPSFYLDMGQTIVEVVVISSDFAPQGCSEPMTLLALPGKALGRPSWAIAASCKFDSPSHRSVRCVGCWAQSRRWCFHRGRQPLGRRRATRPWSRYFQLPGRRWESTQEQQKQWPQGGGLRSCRLPRQSLRRPKLRGTRGLPHSNRTSGATFAGRSQVGRVRCRRSFCAGDLGCFGPRGHAQTLLNAIPPALPAAPLDDGLRLGELADKSLALQVRF